MRVLSILFRICGGRLVLAIILSAIAGLGGAALILLLNRSLGASVDELPSLGWKFASCAAVTLLARWTAEVTFSDLRHHSLATLRERLAEQLGALSYPRIEALGAARGSPVLGQDVANVVNLVRALPGVCIQGTVVLGCLLYLGYLSTALFVVAIAVVLAGAFARHLAELVALKHLRRARDLEDDVFCHFRALFDGAKELKLHARRRAAFLETELLPSVQAVRRARGRGLAIDAAAGTWGNFLFFAAIGGVVFGAGAIAGEEARVQSGYALAFLYMMHPMEMLLEAIPEFSHARTALEHVEAAVGEPVALVPRAAPEDSRSSLGLATDRRPGATILLQQVTHRYRRDSEDGEFELGPLDLALRAGEVVFVVGGNGSGKTTLAKLLVGLYEPESGSIAVDGERLLRCGSERHRQLFSAVFSDFHVFDELLGVAQPALDAKVGELLGALGLADKLRCVDGRFSTTTALSTGQRKRLALLVALLDDRPIYVFDEWAADQDPEYKRLFYQRVLPELRARGKAVLAISHDDRYFSAADRCLRLDGGRWRTLSAADPSLLPERAGA